MWIFIFLLLFLYNFYLALAQPSVGNGFVAGMLLMHLIHKIISSL